jgi:serine/threonine protein kinase
MPRLGELELLAPIGRGGMGVVWSARHLRLGAEVAVKLMPPEDAELFLGEARVLASLSHPHVVTVYDYGTVEEGFFGVPAGAPWLAMELLTPWEQLPPFTRWEDARAMLASVLDALGAVHARGVLHRDVKPSNLLRDAAGRWRVADFGVARLGRVREARRVGTQGFGAPEQLAGRWWEVGPWSDLYAVGRVAAAVIGPEVPAPAGIDEWIARATAASPGERFARAVDALRALEALGPPGEGARHPRAAAVSRTSESSTFSFDAEGWTPVVTTGLPRAAPAAPIPASWPALEPGAAGDPLLGLGLVGLRRPPFVGRIRERAAVWSALREAATGVRRNVHLVGPAGSGRWRLCEECASTAAERGHATPFVVPVGDVDHLVGEVAGWPTDRELAGRVLAELVDTPADDPRFGELLDLVTGRSHQDRGTRAALLAHLLGAMARREPVVLALREGVTGTDALLAALPADVPLLVLTTGPVGAPPPGPGEVVTVEPLGPTEAAALVRSLAAVAAPVVGAAWPGELVRGLAAAVVRGSLRPGADGFRWGAEDRPWSDGAPGADVPPGERLAWVLATWLGPVVDEGRFTALSAQLGISAPRSAVERWLRAGRVVPHPRGFVVAGSPAPVDDLAPELRQRLLSAVGEALATEAPVRAARAMIGAPAPEALERHWNAAQRAAELDELPGLLAELERAFLAAGRERTAADVKGWRAWTTAQQGDWAGAAALAKELLALAGARGWEGLVGSALHTLFLTRDGDPEDLLLRAIDAYDRGEEPLYALSARLHLALYCRPAWGADWLAHPVPDLPEPTRRAIRAQCLAAVGAPIDVVTAVAGPIGEVEPLVALPAVRALLLAGDATGVGAAAASLRARLIDARGIAAMTLRHLEAYAALFAGDPRAAANHAAVLRDLEPALAMALAAHVGSAEAFDRALADARRQPPPFPVGRSVPRRALAFAADAWATHGDDGRADAARALAAGWPDQAIDAAAARSADSSSSGSPAAPRNRSG